jgi:hypothetical protein
MTTGTVPAVKPEPGVQKSKSNPTPGVLRISQQAGNHSGSEASSLLVGKHNSAGNHSSGDAHSSQNSENRKTLKLGALPDKKDSQSRETIEPSSKSPTGGTEKAAKPGKGKKKAQDKVKSKPARKPLAPIKEGVLVSLSVRDKS